MSASCRACGANYHGLVCEYCGAVSGNLKDPDDEKQALNELHELLIDFDPETKRKVLKNGWLPDTTPALIEAGLRCVPIMENSDSDDWDGDIDEIAISRMKAIIMKLKLKPQNAASQQAIREFQLKVKETESKNRRDIVIGCSCLVFVLLGLGCAGAALMGVFGAAVSL